MFHKYCKVCHDFLLITRDFRVKIVGPPLATTQEHRIYILCANAIMFFFNFSLGTNFIPFLKNIYDFFQMYFSRLLQFFV